MREPWEVKQVRVRATVFKRWLALLKKHRLTPVACEPSGRNAVYRIAELPGSWYAFFQGDPP